MVPNHDTSEGRWYHFRAPSDMVPLLGHHVTEKHNHAHVYVLCFGIGTHVQAHYPGCMIWNSMTDATLAHVLRRSHTYRHLCIWMCFLGISLPSTEKCVWIPRSPNQATHRFIKQHSQEDQRFSVTHKMAWFHLKTIDLWWNHAMLNESHQNANPPVHVARQINV